MFSWTGFPGKRYLVCILVLLCLLGLFSGTDAGSTSKTVAAKKGATSSKAKVAIPKKTKKNKKKKVKLASNKQRTGAWTPEQKAEDRKKLWLSQHSVADAIGADVIGTVQIPIHVNLFPIGLDGSGHLGVTLPTGLIEHWADSLEHTMPHLLADNWEHKYGKLDRSQDYSAAIEYAVSAQVVQTAPSVSGAFSRMLHSQHRVVEPPSGEEEDAVTDAFGHRSKVLSPHLQVDGDMVADMVSDLASTVRAPRGYNVAVLNPKRDWIIRSLKTHDVFDAAMEQSVFADQREGHSSDKEGKTDGYGSKAYPPFYGYRAGLSNHELEHVMHDSDVPVWREKLEGVLDTEVRLLVPRQEKEVRDIAVELDKYKRGTIYEHGFLEPWEPVPVRYRTNERALRVLEDKDDGSELGAGEGLRKEEMAQVKAEEEEEARMEAKAKAGDAAAAGDTATKPAGGFAKAAKVAVQNRVHGRVFKKYVTSLVRSKTAARATLTGAVKPTFAPDAVDALSSQWAEEMLTLFPYDHASPGKSVHGITRFLKRTAPYTLFQASATPFTQETCLSDNWVGSERVALLDLAAGPFKWGPIVGGQGVRTYYGFPNVDNLARLSISADPEIYSKGGMLYYDYVKGENRKGLAADALRQEDSESEVITSGAVAAGGSAVHVKANKDAQAQPRVAVAAKKATVANPEVPVADDAREGFVKLEKYGVEDAEEWGVGKKPKAGKEKRAKSKKETPKRKARFGVGRRPLALADAADADAAKDALSLQRDGRDAFTGVRGLGLSEDPAVAAEVHVPRMLRKIARLHADADIRARVLGVADAMTVADAMLLLRDKASFAGVAAEATDYALHETADSAARRPLAARDEDKELSEEEMNNYDNYFTKEELEMMRKVMNPNAKLGDMLPKHPRRDDDRLPGEKPSAVQAAVRAAKDALEAERAQRIREAEPSQAHVKRVVSDDEASKDSLSGMADLFKDDLMAQAMKFLQLNDMEKAAGEPRHRGVVSNWRKGDDEDSSATAQDAFDSAVEAHDLAGHTPGASAGAPTPAAKEEVEEVEEEEEEKKGDTDKDSEAELQELLSQFAEGVDDDDITDLLVDEDDIVKDLEDEQNQDAVANAANDANAATNAAAAVATGARAGAVVADEPVEEVAVNTNVQASLYTTEQIAAEVAMLEQLLSSEACLLKTLDCSDYEKELASLKGALAQRQGKSKKVAVEEEEEETEESDEAEEKEEEEAESDDDVRVQAKLSLSDQANVGEDESGLEQLQELSQERDMWADDDDDDEDEVSEEVLKKYQAKVLQEQRQHKREKEERRRKLLAAMPRGDGASASAWQGEMSVMDHFVSHTMHTIKGYIRDVVAPPVADMHTLKLYHRKVVFSLYVVRNHNLYDPLEGGMFAKLQLALEQARVRGQQFSFQLHELHIATDPSLAMAFTSSMRAAVVPTMLFDGHLSSVKRLYIDSQSLQAELAARLVTRNNPLPKGTKEIPIFLFSLSSELPVFIDKHLQAKALPDMVLAVQSSYHLWESPLTCNGRPIYINLRNPLRALLQSSLLMLGGLLPAHQSYDAVHRTNSQAWQWAVGDHALSVLSSNDEALGLSKHAVDTLHRNYIVHAIRITTGVVNRAVERLSAILPSEANMGVLTLVYDRDSKDDRGVHVVTWEGKKVYKLIRKAHRSVRYRIHKMRKLISRLDYGVAVRHIRELVGTGYQFHSLVEVLRKHAHNMDCLADKQTVAPSLVTMAESKDASVTAEDKDGKAEVQNEKPAPAPTKPPRFTKSSRKVIEKQRAMDGMSAYMWIFGGFAVLGMIVYRCLKAGTKTHAY